MNAAERRAERRAKWLANNGPVEWTTTERSTTMETTTKVRVGYVAKVTAWTADEGKQTWYSKEFSALDPAFDYGAAAIRMLHDNGNASKVVTEVWQTEDGTPKTELWDFRQRSGR